MTTSSESDATLQALGYGTPRGGKGKTIVIVLLLILLIPAIGGIVWLGNSWSDEQAKVLVLQNQVETLSTQFSQLESKNSELSSLLADKQAESERMKEEWATQIETLELQHQEQLQRTYGQMNEIVYDSKKTLAYIGDIETRLRKGEQLNREEAAKITGVINGLTFLHQQYKKPLNEFRELDRYFSRQLATLPEDKGAPRENASLGRRLFHKREIQEEEAQYHQAQGRRAALVEARTRVQNAYASAQRQMASISLDVNQYLVQLDQLVASNQRSADDVSKFFSTSKEILKIHDKIMNITPSSTPEIRP